MSALKKNEDEIVRLRSDDDIEAYRYALSGHGPQHEAVIEVDHDDDLTSVRSKLESTPLPRAVVVIQPKAKTLREGLEYRVLRRLQRELGLDVVLVASDVARRAMARENGFQMVYPSLKAYYRSKDSGTIHIVGTPFTDPEEFTPVVGFGKWGVLIGTILVVLFAAIGYAAIPVGSVTVYPESQVLARDVEVQVETGGPTMDVTAQRLSGRAVQQRVQVQGSIKVSDVVKTPPTPDNPQGPNTITLQVRDALHDSLLKQATDQLNAQLKAGLKSNESLPQESIRTEVIGERYNHGIGDTATELTGYLEVNATGLAYSNDDFNKLVYSLWSQDIPKNFHALGNPTLTPPAMIASEGQHMTLRVKASARVQHDIDADAITNAARWQTPEDTAKAISKLGAFTRPPLVEIWPEWASRAFRIQVKTAVDPALPTQSQAPAPNP